MKKIWFKRKIYGWGWYPATWEGWVTILVWFIVFAAIMSRAEQWGVWGSVFAVASVVPLIAVSFWKGEPPRWQWGDKDKK